VLPLQFRDGENAKTYGLTGKETFEITGLTAPDAREATVVAKDGKDVKTFTVRVMLLTPKEREFYRHGGILPYVLRQLASKPGPAAAKAAA
jgi:aconitate hydratase